MPMLRILNAGGDRNITWNLEALDNGDAEAESAVREAERIFAEERLCGATAFRVAPGAPAERLNEFDPRAEEIVVIPPIAGGRI